MCSILTSRFAIAYEIALVRYTIAQGHPATAASSVVVPLLQSATSAARSTSNDAERTSGYGTSSARNWIVGATLSTTLRPGRRRSSSRATATKSLR